MLTATAPAAVMACAHCGHGGHWVISPMREHRARGFGYLGAVDDIEPLETHICDRCGHTAWYSRRIRRLRQEPGRMKPIDDERNPCMSCGSQRHYLLAQLLEATERPLLGPAPLHVRQTGRNDGEGRFALLLCADCGRCHWFAWGTEAVAAPAHASRCRRCRGDDRRALDSVREDGGQALPVAVQGERPIGQFELRFCNACGYCEWYARDIAALRVDEERVTRVEVEAVRSEHMADSGGPYR